MEQDLAAAAAAAAAMFEDDEWNAVDLDSFMIPNFQSQLSPTTGAYYSMPIQNDVDDFISANQLPRTGNGDHNSLTHFYGLQNQDIGAAYSNQRLWDFEIPSIPSDVTLRNIDDGCLNADFLSCTDTNKFYNTLMPNLPDDNTRSYTNHTSDRNEGNHTSDRNEGNQDVMEDEKKASNLPTRISNAYEDGYNWKKYGQKQVRSSECPRSYLKCTHPNCEAKKIVERALTENLTQIIYKGKHNHPKPLPIRQSLSNEGDTREDNSSHAKSKDGSVRINMNSFSEDDGVASINLSSAGLDTELAESVRNQLSIDNPPDNIKYFNPLDAAANEEVSSPSHRQDADDEYIDDTGAKRRRTYELMGDGEPFMFSSGIREEKIILQTESVIDIIDDGYRWRKYGQKAVKGNPNPRSYYKCTSDGCSVKKHVERNAQNIKDVLTTYEGRHNHDVPPPKNSIRYKNFEGHLPSVPFTAQASHMSLTRDSTFPKFEMPDLFNPHFHRTSFPGNELLRPDLINTFGTGMNFGNSSVYPSDFQLPCRYLTPNIPNLDIPQAGMPSSHASDLVYQPLPMLPGSLNSNMTPDFSFHTEVADQFAQYPGNVFDVLGPKQENMDNIADDSSTASKAKTNETSFLPPIYGQGFPF